MGSTVNSQQGILGWGMQSAKGAVATTWYRHMALQIALGAMQNVEEFAPEAGGLITPVGAYKSMAAFGGSAVLQPRLAGDIGWLLLGLMGKCTTTHGTKAVAAVHAAISVAAATIATGFTALPSARKVAFTVTSTVSGGPAAFAITGLCNGAAQTESLNIPNGAVAAVTVSAKEYSSITSIVITGAASGNVEISYYQTNSHLFTFDTDPATLPWMSVRKYIPGAASASLGEIGLDCKVNGIMLNLPQMGPVTLRPSFIGREPSLAEGPTWTWADVIEEYTSVPIACVTEGGLTLPGFSGTELALLNAQLTFMNQLTSPRDEMLYGAYFPDDFIPLQRRLALQLVVKYSNPDLYQAILTNSTGGTTWDPTVYVSDLSAVTVAPIVIPGSAIKYSMTVAAARVALEVPQSPVINGSGMLMMALTGTVMEPAAGSTFASITLVNEQYDYVPV